MHFKITPFRLVKNPLQISSDVYNVYRTHHRAIACLWGVSIGLVKIVGFRHILLKLTIIHEPVQAKKCTYFWKGGFSYPGSGVAILEILVSRWKLSLAYSVKSNPYFCLHNQKKSCCKSLWYDAQIYNITVF